jgi:hypothetical protein
MDEEQVPVRRFGEAKEDSLNDLLMIEMIPVSKIST